MTERREIEAMESRARRLWDRLRSQALERTGPDGTAHDELVAELRAAMTGGDFALSAMLQIGGGLSIACLEWLNGEGKIGYHAVSAAVELKNTSDEPVHFCSRARPVVASHAVRGMAKATVNGRLVTEYDREYDAIGPGESKWVPVAKAATLLTNHCALARPRSARGKFTGRQIDALRELGGRVVDGGEATEWRVVEPEAEPRRRKTAAGAPPGAEG